MIFDLIISVFLVIAGIFGLVGSYGLVKLPDLMTRLHAPTKASTLGLGGVLLASLLIQALRGQWSIHEILITFFIFLTAPVSANLMAKAALHLRVESKAGHQPVDEADAATPRQG